MYLLNAETTIDWELLATASAPALGDLDIVLITPDGDTQYIVAPIDVSDYIVPTVSTVGLVTYRITPSLEGLYRIRLVMGTANSYTILSKVEMMVFDNTTTTAPYADITGQSLPYDINYYAQGFIVANEDVGVFISSRTTVILATAPASVAKALIGPTTAITTLNLYKDTNNLVGTIVFPLDVVTGVITVPADIELLAGDRLTLRADPGTTDTSIRDISVNLVGCSIVTSCAVT